MRRQAMIMGAAAALAMVGMTSVVPGGAAVQVATSGAPPGSGGKAAQPGPQIGRRADRFVGYGSGFCIERPTYRKRPHGSVARDKRNALKARNQRRNKR